MSDGSSDPVLLWIRHPPHATVHLSEAIRVASMASALDVSPRLLFIAEGVRALVRGQEPYRYSPPIERTLSGIVTEEQPALVHAPSLKGRAIGRPDLVPALPLQLVDDREAAAWVMRARRVVPF